MNDDRFNIGALKDTARLLKGWARELKYIPEGEEVESNKLGLQLAAAEALNEAAHYLRSLASDTEDNE